MYLIMGKSGGVEWIFPNQKREGQLRASIFVNNYPARVSLKEHGFICLKKLLEEMLGAGQYGYVWEYETKKCIGRVNACTVFGDTRVSLEKGVKCEYPDRIKVI